MKSLTYGELPPFDEFYKWVTSERDEDLSVYLPEDKTFHYETQGSDAKVMSKLKLPTEGRFTHEAIYNIIKALIEDGSDDALDIASSFMYTLGYEWI